MTGDTVIRFGLPMRQWQRECAQIRARFLVLAIHRRAGKTEQSLKKLLCAASACVLDMPHYVYIAPFLKQAKIIAWARIKQMVMPLVVCGQAEINDSDLTVTLTFNKAVVRIVGADNPDALRGVRLDGAVLDEVAQQKPEVWEEIVQPALSDRKGWAWFIGTPKGINLFSSLFFAAESREGWARVRYTVYDTDALDVDEIARLRATMSETAFAREFLCDFTAAGDDQLISLTDADAAAKLTYPVGAMDYAPKILGVDPARFGNDRSVIFPRQGLVAFEPLIYRGIDNMDLAARLCAKIEEWKPDAVFIDAGAGAGVIDRSRQLGHDVIEVNFGGKPINPRFANRRAEMWSELADAVRSGLAIPKNDTLKLELSTPTYRFDAANRIILESKDDIKKRLPDAGSPDLADALALTYAAPVSKRDDIGHHRQVRRAEYDPYQMRT